MDYFFIGVVFAIAIMPLLEDFTAVLQQFTEYLKMVFAVKIYKLNKLIKQDSEEETPVIGFQLPNNQEEEQKQD